MFSGEITIRTAPKTGKGTVKKTYSIAKVGKRGMHDTVDVTKAGLKKGTNYTAYFEGKAVTTSGEIFSVVKDAHIAFRYS